MTDDAKNDSASEAWPVKTIVTEHGEERAYIAHGQVIELMETTGQRSRRTKTARRLTAGRRNRADADPAFRLLMDVNAQREAELVVERAVERLQRDTDELIASAAMTIPTTREAIRAMLQVLVDSEATAPWPWLKAMLRSPALAD